MSANQPEEAEIVTTAIAVRPSMAVGQAMSVKDILDQVKLIQEVMRAVMTEGEHYGTIPGCGEKKTLLQPGAQKLTMTFRLAPEYQIQEVNLEKGHKEYRVICTLKSMLSGAFVGQGVGCCSSMESKYRYRGGVRKCPECGKEAIIKGKAQFGGGWLCWAKKGGCGEKWEDGAQEIESQSIEKVENPDPADTFNTVLKMAKKRAFVDATITATAASDIFTQDIGDDEGGIDAEPVKTSSNSPAKSTKGVSRTSAQGKPAPQNPPMPTEKTREWMLMHLKAEKGQPSEPLVAAYFKAIGKILPNETLSDLPCRFVAGNHAQLRALGKTIADFEGGAVAKEAFAPHVETGQPAGENKKPAATPAKQPELPPQEEKKKEPPSPAVTAAAAKDPEWFFDVIVHVPPKGMKKIDYMKNPHTIGWLYEQRHDSEDARKRLFGFVHNYEAAGWTDGNQKFHPATESDKTLRLALDAFAEFEEKHKNDTAVERGREQHKAPDDPGDDIPF